MRLIAKKPCSYGGKKFFIGDEIPAELVVNIEREEKLGVISAANDEAGVPEQSGALYSQEQVDKMIADAVANADKGFTQEQVDEMIQSAVAELKPFDSDNAGFTVTVKSDYLKEGQVFITGHYGLLRYKAKPHVLMAAHGNHS